MSEDMSSTVDSSPLSFSNVEDISVLKDKIMQDKSKDTDIQTIDELSKNDYDEHLKNGKTCDSEMNSPESMNGNIDHVLDDLIQNDGSDKDKDVSSTNGYIERNSNGLTTDNDSLKESVDKFSNNDNLKESVVKSFDNDSLKENVDKSQCDDKASIEVVNNNKDYVDVNVSDKNNEEKCTNDDKNLPVAEESTFVLRRSSRNKSINSFQETDVDAFEEVEMDEEEEEEIDDEIESTNDVVEIKDFEDEDSDVVELDMEDPLGDIPEVSTSQSRSGVQSSKKSNVVTIDNVASLRLHAVNANKSRNQRNTSDQGLVIVDTNKILAERCQGVSILPSNSRGSTTGMTDYLSKVTRELPSGVTITQSVKPSSKPATSNIIRPVETTSYDKNDINVNDDDGFVVEAPSFIVPYVYEKPPKETFASFKQSIQDLMDKNEKTEEGVTDTNEEKSSDITKEVCPDKQKSSEKVVQNEPELQEISNSTKSAKSFFDSTLGLLLSELGTNLVQECVQSDLLKQHIKKSQKDRSASIFYAIKSLKENLETSREKNKLFSFDLKKCKFCSFRTESNLALQHHLETPHMRNMFYCCNFCSHTTRMPQAILSHIQEMHGVRGRLDRMPGAHQCPQCLFEDNLKSKLSRHKPSCDKRYHEKYNQAPPHDWDPPAKIHKPPMMRNVRSLNSIAALNNMFPVNTGSGFRGNLGYGTNSTSAQGKFGTIRGRNMGASYAVGSSMRNVQQSGSRPIGFSHVRQNIASQYTNNSVVLQALNKQTVGNQNSSGSVTIQNINQLKNRYQEKSNQPSISITALPGKSGSAFPSRNKVSPGFTSKATLSMPIKPGQPGTSGNGEYVICEICDGYIKDHEQLRNHMQWIHKVKIHPRMIHSRPPLNCQKCQYRFFTDQGLERHLLGSHGLVTASMQELANKGRDSGRCPVCGKMYQYKLLNHVAKEHLKTLKPAHLSYKCTVCTATFGQYKLFENHVYTAHSGAAKKAERRKIEVSGPVPPKKIAWSQSAVRVNNSIQSKNNLKEVPSKDVGKRSSVNRDPDIINLDEEEDGTSKQKSSERKSGAVDDCSSKKTKLEPKKHN